MMVQYLRFTAFLSCFFGLQMAAHSQVPVIVNGGFESGFAGWTRADQIGSEGTFVLQTGTLSPVNGDPMPAPPQGTRAAMTDAGGPGSHVLYQDFVASGSSGSLRFALFLGNRSDRYATPASLDFSTPALNQQARVDIMRAGADPFSVAPADILLTLYRTQVGDPLINGYFTVTTDIGALLAAHTGEVLRLRFAEADNVGPFQFGVDNVRIEAAATPVVFYSKSSDDLHNVLTWGANPDGSGANPTDFGTGKTFNLANRPGIYTMTGNWTVDGTLNIPAASQLQISNFILNIADLTGTGSFSGTSASTLFVNQPSSGGTTLNFIAGANDLKDLVILSTATTVLAAPLNVFNVLFVSNGGTLNTGNALTLKSTAVNTARVGPVTGSIIGNVIIERYIPARRAWRILSAPVGSAQTINAAWQEGATTSSPNPDPSPGFGTHITEGSAANGLDHNPLTAMMSIKRYVSAANTWTPLANTNATAVNSDAFMLFVRGNRGITLGYNDVPPTSTTLRATGPLKTGDQTFAVSGTGFTAIPNPFACNINFATLTRNNVQNNFYLWDPKMGGANGVGAYVLLSFNGSSYDITPAPVSPESQYIQSGQGFLVRTVTAGVSGSLTIKENDKVNTPSTDVFRIAGSSEVRATAPVFEDPTKGQGLRLRLLTVEEDKTTAVLDEVFTSYKTTHSNEIDQWDADKANNVGENLGMVREGRTLVIERKALPKESDVIQLKLWNTKTQTYSLEVNPVNLNSTGLLAFIEDSYLHLSTPVSLTEVSRIHFSVNSDPASARTDRFKVLLTNKNAPLNVHTGAQNTPDIAVHPNPIDGTSLTLHFINEEPGVYQVSLLNAAGQVVFRKSVQHGGGTAAQVVQLDRKLEKGVYQLQVSGKSETVNKKIMSN